MIGVVITMTWSEDQARWLAYEVQQRTGGAKKLLHVSAPSPIEPTRWVCSGMPQEVYLGPTAAGKAFAAVLADLETTASLPDPDPAPAP